MISVCEWCNSPNTTAQPTHLSLYPPSRCGLLRLKTAIFCNIKQILHFPTSPHTNPRDAGAHSSILDLHQQISLSLRFHAFNQQAEAKLSWLTAEFLLLHKSKKIIYSTITVSYSSHLLIWWFLLYLWIALAIFFIVKLSFNPYISVVILRKFLTPIMLLVYVE